MEQCIKWHLSEREEADAVRDKADGEKEELAARLEKTPLVDHSGHEALDGAELRVDAHEKEHEEEERGPQRREPHLRHAARVHEEREARPARCHRRDRLALHVRHVANQREDHEAREKRRAVVHERHQYRLPEHKQSHSFQWLCE